VAPTIIDNLLEAAISNAGLPCSIFRPKENTVKPDQPSKRPRGSGWIFKNGSDTLWIGFSDRGIVHRENTHSTDRKTAENLLALRLAELKTDTYVPRTNIRVDELVADLLAEYREKQQKSIGHVKRRWKLHLCPFFTRRRASDVSTEMIRRYIAKRTEASASPATINRELAILKRAFNLALESTPAKVKLVPYIPMFTERNVRKGFLQDAQYSALANEAAKEGLWLRALLAVAYNFGWRKSELLNLRVSQVDLLSRTIRLEVGETKNDAGRLVKMPDEIFTLLSALVTGKKGDDYVFTRDNGKRVKCFDKVWDSICKRAGVPDLLFHDLRRTGARNLRRLGIAESVAMKVTGHKTPSIFKRYDITDESDMIEVAARLDEKRQLAAEKKSRAPEFSQSFDRINNLQTKGEATADPKSSTAVLPN